VWCRVSASNFDQSEDDTPIKTRPDAVGGLSDECVNPHAHVLRYDTLIPSTSVSSQSQLVHEEMTGAHSAAEHNSFRFDQFVEEADYRQE